jgi:hypothetical protein
MRNRKRTQRAGNGPARRIVTHQPPTCREVTVEVAGVSSSLQRIDIVADDAPGSSTPVSREVPVEIAGASPELQRIDLIAEPTNPTRPIDPWDRLTR